jgi:hypothetical protein
MWYEDYSWFQFSICCTLALVFVYLKAIYLVASAWITDISLRNPFIVHPLGITKTNNRMRVGMSALRLHQVPPILSVWLTTDFLAALLCVIAGLMAPADRREAAKQFASEQHMQQQGARYNYDGEPPVEQPKYNGMNGGMSYART